VILNSLVSKNRIIIIDEYPKGGSSMAKSKPNLCKTLLLASLTGAFALVSSVYQSAGANTKPRAENESLANTTLISLQFQPPGDVATQTSIGGGVRGQVQFAAPTDAPLTTTLGGGVRGKVQFAAPTDAPLTTTLGGGVRGKVQFALPRDGSVNTVGGGVRGNVNFGAPGDVAPANTVGGGTRADELKLTALVPESNIGRTLAARPTFYVYLPPTSSKQVFFSIQDEARNHVYQTKLGISGQGGIVSFTLPDNAPELEVGKNYAWFFAPLDKDGVLRPDNYDATGWVKRVEASSYSSNNGLTPVEVATEYAKNGIWYDTLDVLVNAKRQRPEDATLNEEWGDLLEQVGLKAIADLPIAEQL